MFAICLFTARCRKVFHTGPLNFSISLSASTSRRLLPPTRLSLLRAGGVGGRRGRQHCLCKLQSGFRFVSNSSLSANAQVLLIGVIKLRGGRLHSDTEGWGVLWIGATNGDLYVSVCLCGSARTPALSSMSVPAHTGLECERNVKHAAVNFSQQGAWHA